MQISFFDKLAVVVAAFLCLSCSTNHLKFQGIPITGNSMFFDIRMKCLGYSTPAEPFGKGTINKIGCRTVWISRSYKGMFPDPKMLGGYADITVSASYLTSTVYSVSVVVRYNSFHFFNYADILSSKYELDRIIRITPPKWDLYTNRDTTVIDYAALKFAFDAYDHVLFGSERNKRTLDSLDGEYVMQYKARGGTIELSSVLIFEKSREDESYLAIEYTDKKNYDKSLIERDKEKELYEKRQKALF